MAVSEDDPALPAVFQELLVHGIGRHGSEEWVKNLARNVVKAADVARHSSVHPDVQRILRRCAELEERGMLKEALGL